MKPHWSGISARPKTWPLYSTGGSQSPHPLTQDRYRGFPAFRQRFMIITYGASTWRSGRSSSSASQNRSETVPVRTANSRSGHRRAAIRPLPCLAKSRSGVPPSASTPKTTDQPEQDNCRPWPPCGNRTSTEKLPYAASALAQTQGNARLVDPLKITSAKIDIVCLQHVLFVLVARPGRACERQCQLKKMSLINAGARPDQMAGMKSSPRVHDRPRCSEALGLATNSHRNRSIAIHR